MAAWRFLDYITEEGSNLISDWYEAQDDEVKVQFDVTLDILSAISDWEADEVEEFKPLTNAHVGLGEIVFHIVVPRQGTRNEHKRRFRPVGIWPTDTEHEFVLLMGCEKYGRTYIPHAAFDTALTHLRRFREGRGTTREHV